VAFSGVNKGQAMKTARRQFLSLAAGAVAFPSVARAQTYPARPVRIVVGFPPGGVADLYARLVAQWLSDRLGQQFIIDNRTGAGGNIATESVTRAAPDGYTLLWTSSTDAWNGTLYDNLSYNYIRDIAPVASVVRFAGVVVVQPTFPAQTIPNLIAYARTNSGKLTMASGGIGSVSHVSWELFKGMTKLDMVHVPYRGEGPALLDLLGGQVQVMIPSLPPSIEYIRGGKLRALAVTNATRLGVLPDVPTIGEFLAGYESSAWAGLGAPRNTPPEIVDRINKEIDAALADTKILERITDQGGEALPGSSAEFAKMIAADSEKWGKVIRAAGIKAG
jgi:tripartite-type tricarboxylate transporter receptor subunit TctC